MFLRAVNVGGRKYPMADLRAVLTEAGYEQVETHIQTGNVRLTSPTRSRAKLESALEELFENDRGFTVGVVAFTPRELAQVARDATELGEASPAAYGHYVSLLKDTPSAKAVADLEALSREGERVVVRGRAVHLLCDVPYHVAKTSNAAVEKVAGIATNRNAKVVHALCAKWC